MTKWNAEVIFRDSFSEEFSFDLSTGSAKELSETMARMMQLSLEEEAPLKSRYFQFCDNDEESAVIIDMRDVRMFAFEKAKEEDNG